MTTDYRALCLELLQHLSRWYGVVVASGIGSQALSETSQLLNRARLALQEAE